MAAAAVWTGTVSATWATVGNWNDATGIPATAAPTISDDVTLGTGSGATNNACTMSSGDTCRSIDCTSYTGILTLPNATITIGRWFKFVAGMTLTLTSATGSVITLNSTSNNGGAGWPITCGGKSLGPLTLNGSGGKWTCQDALKIGTGAASNAAQTLTLTRGQLDLGSFTHDTNQMFIDTNFSTISGTGTVNLWGNGSNQAVMQCSATTGSHDLSGLTFVVAANTSSTRMFELGPSTQTWGTITYTVAGSGILRFRLRTTSTGTSGTINNLNVTTGKTLSFRESCTFSLPNGFPSGAAGSLITVSSETAGSSTTLAFTNPTTCSYCSFKDVVATPDSAVYALDSTSVSGNTGIIFEPPAAHPYIIPAVLPVNQAALVRASRW